MHCWMRRRRLKNGSSLSEKTMDTATSTRELQFILPANRFLNPTYLAVSRRQIDKPVGLSKQIWWTLRYDIGKYIPRRAGDIDARLRSVALLLPQVFHLKFMGVDYGTSSPSWIDWLKNRNVEWDKPVCLWRSRFVNVLQQKTSVGDEQLA